MKATGIVRRIDDLGRVVIPKEIRRTMRIREGDPLEIYTSRDGEVIFKKYSPMGELGDFVAQLCESLSKTTGASCLICDRDSVIAAAGNAKKDLYEKSISPAVERLMEERKHFETTNESEAIDVCAGQNSPASVVMPIITEGDVSGCVIFLSDSQADPVVEIKLAQTAANFLSKQMQS